MRATYISVVCLGLLFTAIPLAAHHSFAAEYDESQPVILRGTLTKMDWVNPHGWIHIDVKNPDGTVVNWAVEAGGPNALLRRGLRKTDFPPGIELVIHGFRAKDGSNTANGRTVATPDGKNFFMGSSQGDAPKDGADSNKAVGGGGY